MISRDNATVETVMIRKLATTIVLGGSIALSFLPVAALAYPPWGWDRAYYDDAAHTNYVGGETKYCNGYASLWYGVRTPYYDEERFPCD